jgi:hypothetical protein
VQAFLKHKLAIPMNTNSCRRVRSLCLGLLTLTILAGVIAWQTAATPGQPEKSKLLAVLQAAGPKYWKGNLHTHSFWSDGDDFPEMIADWYREKGYNFLTLSDHNILSEGQRWMEVPDKSAKSLALEKYRTRFGDAWVEQRTVGSKKQVRLKPLSEFRSLLDVPGKFMMIQGEEVTHRFAKSPVHMGAINLRDVIIPLDGDSVKETIQVNHRAVQEQMKKTGKPILVALNHPNWGWGVRAEDMITAEEMRYFEVYNGHPGVKNYGDEIHPSCERLWDIVLALRLGKFKLPLVYGLATDDAHRYHEWGVGKVNPGRGWVMVKAPYLSTEAIIRAMLDGDFYFSTGVTLKDIQRDGKTFRLHIDGAKGVKYKTQFIATLKDAPLDAKPQLDKDGKPLNVTGIYSPQIGKVVAEVEGLAPAYQLTGDELYVRAKVISTRPHPNPYAKGDVELAWTQPVVP